MSGRDRRPRSTEADAAPSARETVRARRSTPTTITVAVRRSGRGQRRLVHDPARSIVSLIGPNGAGKTTFFNVLTGLYEPTDGRGLLRRRATSPDCTPHKIASLGLARTFQNIRLFGLMTAEENVMVAMHSHLKSGIFGTVLRLPRQRREEREAREAARRAARASSASAGAAERVRPQPLLRRPAPARGGPCARAQAQGAAARRADRRDEPAGVGRIRRLRPPGPRREAGLGAADRARHERGHAGVRADHRARPRARRSPRAPPTTSATTRG